MHTKKVFTPPTSCPLSTHQLARLAVAFGMVVIIVEGSRHENGRQASSKAAAAREAGVTLPPLPLDKLLPKCDFLSLHCPLTAESRGLISGQELALMKPSAMVVNAARGGVVDERGACVLSEFHKIFYPWNVMGRGPCRRCFSLERLVICGGIVTGWSLASFLSASSQPGARTVGRRSP